MAKIDVDFLGVKFKNPTVVASGVLGVTGALLKRVVDEFGAGGVTCKSIWLQGHEGHPNPTIICSDHWMLNAVGLPDAGILKAKEELSWYKENCDGPLIASIVAGTAADFGEIAEEITKINPDIIEVNISCPNVEDELGKPFACDVDDAANVTRQVKKRTNLPVVMKLSPNVVNIGQIAKSVVDAGADAICAINTVGPGMAIDIGTGQPILHNKVGGVSGYGIKPIAVKCIFDIAKSVNVPIIGTGGVFTGEDAIELMMAGATLVGIGTAVYYRGKDVFGKVAKEMEDWMDKNGVSDINEIVGKSHKL